MSLPIEYNSCGVQGVFNASSSASSAGTLVLSATGSNAIESEYYAKLDPARFASFEAPVESPPTSAVGLLPTVANILTVAFTWRETLSPQALHQIFVNAILSLPPPGTPPSPPGSNGSSVPSEVIYEALDSLAHALELLGHDFSDIRATLADPTVYRCARRECGATFYAWQNGPRRCVVRHMEPIIQHPVTLPGPTMNPPRIYPCCGGEWGAPQRDGRPDDGTCFEGWHLPVSAADYVSVDLRATATHLTHLPMGLSFGQPRLTF